MHCVVVIRGKVFQAESKQSKKITSQLRYVVNYKVRKMAKSLLKYHCYCPMLLMRTTKTYVRLQTKAISRHLYGFSLVF